jgi:hypothetical protein
MGPLTASVSPGLSCSCTYLLTTPFSYFLMSSTISPSCSGREIGVYGRTAKFPFLSRGAPDAPSDARTTTSDVMGESAAALGPPGSSKTKHEVLWLYGSIAFSFRSRKRSGSSADVVALVAVDAGAGVPLTLPRR